MSRSRAGVRLRSIELRAQLYASVLELRKQGLSYNRILALIQEHQGVSLSKSHLSNWLRGIHLPTGSARSFNGFPTPELAYIIGVKMGDASLSLNRNYAHKVKLRAKDKDFVEEFARCLSLVLRRNCPPVRWVQSRHFWRSETSSVLLRHFLLRPFEALRPVIEYSDECLAAFLRGFFDSEGSVSGKSLTVSNSDFRLLSFICTSLRERFRIETTGPHLLRSAGGVVVIKGKSYRVNKDLYYVRVRTKSLPSFETSVGFTIRRKMDALRSATLE